MTRITAEDVLAAEWRPHDEVPGVVLVELGDDHGAPELCEIDFRECVGLDGADLETVTQHVIDLHNAHRAPRREAA